MIEDLASTLQQTASRWNFKLEEAGTPGVYRMDVAIKQQDGNFRFQFVFIWKMTEKSGRERIFINSRCGYFTPSVNLYDIMKESLFCNYSTIGITTDKDKNGNPCESVVVQTVPALALTTPQMLDELIYEVAVNADIIERKFFGGVDLN